MTKLIIVRAAGLLAVAGMPVSAAPPVPHGATIEPSGYVADDA